MKTLVQLGQLNLDADTRLSTTKNHNRLPAVCVCVCVSIFLSPIISQKIKVEAEP